MKTEGWAIVTSNNMILVETVSPSARGAKVNWLFTFAQFPVNNTHTEQEINQFFDKLSAEDGEQCRRVAITVAMDA